MFEHLIIVALISIPLYRIHFFLANSRRFFSETYQVETHRTSGHDWEK
jgi:hypothetical protein